MPLILFVCTANRYRSPIAEACFKRLADSQSHQPWDVASAGTWTENGLPPMPEAIQKADEMGLDIRSHRSRAITSEILRSADLTIVMEYGQKDALQIEFPFAAQKIYLLTELCTKISYSIPDPVKAKGDKQAAAEICRLINAGFEAICARALGNEK